MMHLKIRGKLITISLLLLALPSLIIGISSYLSAKSSLDELGATGLKNNVVMATQMIDLLDKEVKKGELTLEQAQEAVKTKLLGEKQSDGTRTLDTNVDMGSHGYFFILDEKGTALAHPVREGENMIDSQTPSGLYSTKEIIGLAQKGGGFINFDFEVPGEAGNLQPKIIYAEQDPNWGWVITSGSYLMDFNSGAKSLLTVLVIVLSSSLLIGTIISLIFSSHLAKPIGLITDQVSKVANGDLTSESLKIRNQDEIGELSTYINQMTHNLKEMIHNVSNASLQVAGTSEQLSASSEETSKLVQQVAESIQEVASGAETQVDSTSQANDAVAIISDRITEIVSYVESVNESSNKTADEAENGNNVINRTIDHMRKIQQQTSSTADMVNVLGDKSNEIGKIVSMITSVAEQTNLLALNASIEAARAGEHGQGFAVVANEVRKLAEQSRDATNQISSLIDDIQQDIKQSVAAMNEGRNSVDGGIELVDEAGASFKGIVSAVRDVSNQIEEVSVAVQDMSSGTASMVKTIDETARIASESASYTENIAAAAEQQSASVEEITSVSEMLAKMAEELQDSVSAFKI